MDEIVRPTIEALAAQGTPYSGILYAGLMLTRKGPQLIEYNARFGDPECQVLMMRLESDLLGLLLAVARGKLAEHPRPVFSKDAALTVVMAAEGYPDAPRKGGTIKGVAEAEGKEARIFHAGTALDGKTLVASGGRVLNVTALGKDVAEARRQAYKAVEMVDFPSGFYRNDIGWREIERATKKSKVKG
jgi:phosphoribosylamine--glycine ligase